MSTFTKRAIDSLKEMMLWASTDENGEPISPEHFDPQFAAAMARAESVLAEEDATP